MIKWIEDVRAFHKKFGLSYDGPPRAIEQETVAFRHSFGIEELREYRENANMAVQTRRWIELGVSPGSEAEEIREYHKRLEGILDSIVDQIYVALGTAHLHGLDQVLEEAWDRAHHANMGKVRATSPEQSKRGSTLDVVKPEGWIAPNHLDLVADHDLSGVEK